MEILSPDQHERVTPLVRASGMRGHLAFVYEVIDKTQPGIVYVDHCQNPQTALVCNESGFFFAFGEPDETVVHSTIMQLWSYKRWPYFTCLFGSTPAWGKTLRRILEPHGAKPTARLGFELREEIAMPPIPPGYRLEPIDMAVGQSILDGSGTSSYGIDPWFIRIRGGAEGYAAHGLGLALICEGQIASLCGFCALANREAELEVGTVPAQRGKGLAMIASRAFMDQCRTRGFEPIYTCTSTNLASRVVAQKLGYVEVEEVTGYDLSIEA